MSVFYQQSGRRGEVDFKKTLVSSSGELRYFTLDEFHQKYEQEVDPRTVGFLRGTSHFQIWGVPAQAHPTVRRMRIGDLVLLIGFLSPNSLEDGQFFYAGRVVHIRPTEDFGLSQRLWGSNAFPFIFFMQGKTINYSWLEFSSDFKFKQNYFVAGYIVRVPEDRLANSVFVSQERLALRLGIDPESIRASYPAPE